MNKRQTGGFTLIELLVALAIVSLVAVLSWQGLDNVIRLTQRIRQTDDQWEQMRAVFAQLERDLKSVHNPRSASFAGTGTPGGASGQPGQPGTSPLPGQERASGRTDVIVEDENNLDAVVNSVMENTRRVQVNANALELLGSVTTPREGPATLRIRWILRNGELRREQTPLVPPADGGARTLAPGTTAVPSMQTLFDEPGLVVRGVGVRLWVDGRGWDTEQNLGAVLPPEPVQSNGSPPASTGAVAGGTVQNVPGSGPLRFRGLQLRIWLPSGDVYTRIFMLGQES